MVRHLAAFFLLSAGCIAAEPKPVFVVIEQDPWLMVIGSDSPTFALYDDGTIIYRRDKPGPEGWYLRRKVSEAKKSADELVSFRLGDAKDSYQLTSADDHINTVLWTASKRVEVYGNWRMPRSVPAEASREVKDAFREIIERERKMWEAFPAEIRRALLRVDEQRKLPGEAWLPERVEVMFWPYEHAPDESIEWPKEWPDLAARDSKKRAADSHSVFLPSEKYPALRRFLDTRQERGAVLINGKKMAVAVRFPFPGEEAWRP